MVEEKVLDGGLNTDDNDLAIKPNQYRNAINCRVVSSAGGKIHSVVNVLGNKAVTDAVKYGTGDYRSIGSYEDEKNGRIYTFLWNADGHHAITQYDKATDTTTLLLNNDLFRKDGVNTGLGFERAKLITGVDKVGDILFWTDPKPRRINVKRLLEGQFTSFDDDLISLIRRPPDLPPTWLKTKTGTSGMVSLIKDGAFQFAWRFVYNDGEQSVFSPYSTMADYGTETDTMDTVQVTLPLDNQIKQDVRFVELAVRTGNTGNLFIVKRWDKDNPTDATAIQDHNAGAPLMYNFMNDVIGEGVPEADGVKPFENIPLTSGDLVACDNRIFLGDNKSDYNTPASTSLTVTKQTTTIDVAGEKITAEWWWVSESYHTGLNKDSHTAWVLKINGYAGIKDGFYGVDGVQYSEEGSYITTHDNTRAPDVHFSFPEPVNYDNMKYIGTADSDIMNFYGFLNNGTRQFHKGLTTHADATIAGAPTQNSFKPQKVFKTGTSYQLGIVFYDRYLRSSSVVTNDDLKVRIDQTSYDNEKFTNQLTWAITNGAVLTEIPEWAEYYSIVMTKNARTRFFMQTFPYAISYVSKDDTGIYQTEAKPYATTFAGIQIDITSLSKDNLGYVFNKGDVVNLYPEGRDMVSLSVIGQYGKYIICNLADLGDLTTTPSALMELYTPYKASTIEPFWENGQMYPITDPGTDTRAYGALTGSIKGDTWIIARKFSSVSTNGVEAMSPNDKYYQNWWTDAGRPNTTPQPGIGQSVKEGGILFSNQYIPQTLINGLSSFDVANSHDLPDSCGAIRKMIYTSKVQGELGGVLLAICENETVSIYIGETQVQTQDGNSFLAASPGVIGTVNILRGSYGTINPESVVEKDGNVYFLDRKHGKVIRYAVNGLYPISDYKMKNFFDTRCKDLAALTTAEMTTLGLEGIFCYGGFDDVEGQYLLFMPRVTEDPTFLEDITRNTPPFSTIFANKQPNYHVFDDGRSMILAFDKDSNFWTTTYKYEPEYFGHIGSTLYSYKNGKLYQHEGAAYNTFYGEKFPSIIAFIANQNALNPKIFTGLILNATQAPDYVHLRTEVPWSGGVYHQSTDLVKSEFKINEGKFDADFFFDRLSPNNIGTYDEKMKVGDKMRANVGMIMIEFDEYDKEIELQVMGVVYQPSSGHIG